MTYSHSATPSILPVAAPGWRRRYGDLTIRQGHRGAHTGVSLALGAVLVLGACSVDGGSGTDERQGAIYAASIRAVANGTTEGMAFDRPVYVAATRGHEIDLEVQAEVVEQLDDLTVRFVDESDEAVEESTDDASVLDDGLLVTLGTIRGRGGERTVSVETYLRAGDEDHYEVTLERREGRWVVTGQASQGT